MLPDAAFQRVGGRMTLEGGGSSAPEQKMTTRDSSLPSYLQPYQDKNLANSQEIAGRGYTPYGGTQIAGFNQVQQNAQAGVTGMGPVQQFAPAINQTQNTMQSSWNDPGVAASFMNPYQQNVTDIANREAARQSTIQGLADQTHFATAGAFGGSRHGIMDAERQRNLAQLQNDTQMQGANQAYNTGMGQYNVQNQNQLSAANQLASLGTNQQATDLSLYGAQNAVGNAQQAQTQTELDQQQKNFVEARDWDKNQASWMQDIIKNNPTATSFMDSETSQAAAPNAVDQLVSLGGSTYNAGQQDAAAGQGIPQTQAKKGGLMKSAGIAGIGAARAMKKSRG
jgi:hypothetical protein